MLLRQLQVTPVERPCPLDLVVAYRPHNLARYSHDDAARRDDHAFGDQAAGGDDALFANDGAAEQRRPHADEGVAADADAVEDRAVADDDAGLDLVGEAG